MRLFKHGWISALGWAALACWALFFGIFSNLDQRHLDPNQHPALGVLAIGAAVLTYVWIHWRLRLLRWRMRSEAWYGGHEEAREHWRKEHQREKHG